MTLAFRGLAAQSFLGREGNVQKFRERVLNIYYDYVDSRWTNAKELKYSNERWEVKVIDLADRGDADKKAADESTERLKQLEEKIKELRKTAPKDREGDAPAEPPPPKSSSVPAAGGVAEAAAGNGVTDPVLLQSLAAAADKPRSVRATFTETLGSAARRQKATGTLCLRQDKRFVVERSLDLGLAGQAAGAIKELRVFDGQSLWIHIAAKELGDGVRRWEAAATRREWYTVPGRPEVDFATLVNPLRAWRLFGSDLVRLGVEQLPTEPAYVLEVRPDAKFRPVLTGPVASELLGLAAGRRIRFWIGAKSGFQYRVRVYDEADEVVASLECSDLDLDARVPDTRFAFVPPAGVKVLDMNAVMAANEKP
jgi:outer membrane lipoprotein-sorting protein